MGTRLKEPGMAFLTIARDIGEDLKPGLDALADNMRFAKQNDYQALEVAVFPKVMGGTVRDFYGETLNIDWCLANEKEAIDGIKRLEGETGVVLEALCYCANPIGNLLDRQHVDKAIIFAIKAGIPNVVGFIGNLNGEIEAAKIAGSSNWKGGEREAYFRFQLRQRIAPMVKRANYCGVDYAVEPCSMRGAMGPNKYSLTTNWFSNPHEWDIVIAEVPGIKMWYDASHTRNYRAQNQGDPRARIPIEDVFEKYGKYIVGVHLKDGEDNIDGMERHWGMGNPFADNEHTGDLWIARQPGKGQIEWDHFERCVRKYAPQALVRSVEMEDLDITGRAANERALIEVAKFYKPIIAKCK